MHISTPAYNGDLNKPETSFLFSGSDIIPLNTGNVLGHLYLEYFLSVEQKP